MTAGAATDSTARRDRTERIRAECRRLGFEAAGIAPLLPSDHAEFYRAWLAAGRHGDMSYLARPDAVEARLDPAGRWPGLRSAIVVTLRYYGDGDGCSDASRAIIARYARGRDYHKVLKKKLLALLDWLERDVGRALPAARAYVDTGPVLERELARRAGLGWFGRNTMLLHPRRGSYWFIGVLLTELDLEADAPFERNHCGTCNACVDACPTGALLGRDASGAPVMDATRCISYLTIEQRGPIPRELRPLIGNRVFGCDICQEVCPWNSSGAGPFSGERAASSIPTATETAAARVTSGFESRRRFVLPVVADLRARDVEAPRLVDLMRMTYEEWDVWSRGRAVRRAGYAGLKRNVAVALGNSGAEEAVPALVEALNDAEPLVRGHAGWALGQFLSASTSATLADRLVEERDAVVREELRRALGRIDR